MLINYILFACNNIRAFKYDLKIYKDFFKILSVTVFVQLFSLSSANSLHTGLFFFMLFVVFSK